MELLIVIAIIAILAAIIFPVYSAAKETANRDTAISNMHAISQGLARYVSDHDGKYPPVLFAYADGSNSMHGIATAYTGSSPQFRQYMLGIYPTYVNDPSKFMDPDNQVSDSATVGPISVNALQTVGQSNDVLAKDTVARRFYQDDAYDISPEIIGPKQVADGSNGSPAVYVPRYQAAWTSPMDPTVYPYTPPTFSTTPVGSEGITYDEYNRQLFSKTAPSGDTYVTCDTYHVNKQNMVVVLFADGTAKSMDASKFLATFANHDSVDISADNKGVANQRFWMVTSTGAH